MDAPDELGEVVVIGSVNIDYRIRVPRLPQPGETILADSIDESAGGKGGNQAVAAARMGATVRFIGGLGSDVEGDFAREDLSSERVNGILDVFDGTPTGRAYIAVDHGGQNEIIVVRGANARLTGDEITAHLSQLPLQRPHLVLSLEIEFDAVVACASFAHERGWPIIVNPAPAHPGTLALCEFSPIFTPNHNEATELAGGLSLRRSGEHLRSRTGNHVVITDGDRGALLFRKEGGVRRFEAPKVEVRDTTGAGDTFTGVFAALLSMGTNLDVAVATSVSAAAHSVGFETARAGMPTADQISIVSPDPIKKLRPKESKP